jgi:hypothetical protein
VTLSSFLGEVVAVLDEAGVPYMITGSLAAAHYAAPRATQDVDVVVEVSSESLDHVVAFFQARGLYVSSEAAREAHHTRGQFNAVDPDRGWKADVIIRKDRPFSISEFSRRLPATLMGLNVFIPTLEDLILAKLEWASLGDSDLQRRDVSHLLQVAGDTIDRDYLLRWIRELGLGDEWKRVEGGGIA